MHHGLAGRAAESGDGGWGFAEEMGGVGGLSYLVSRVEGRAGRGEDIDIRSRVSGRGRQEARQGQFEGISRFGRMVPAGARDLLVRSRRGGRAEIGKEELGD